MTEHAQKAFRLPPGRLLSIAEVARETSLHRATIYRQVRAGTFPKAIKLGAKRVAWAERDVELWKAQLIAASSAA